MSWAWDWGMNWSTVGSVAHALTIFCDKELNVKGGDLPANLHPYLHLWSWTLDNDQKSEITDTNKQIQASFKWGLGSPLATRRRAPLSPGSEIWQGMPPVCFSHVLPGRGPGEDPEIAGVITSLVLSWRRWPRRGKSGPFCLNLLPLWPRSGWAAANGLKDGFSESLVRIFFDF